MGILSITTDFAGQILCNPRRVRIVTTDSLSTVTTAGYLNEANLTGYQILPTDVFDIIYSYVSASSPGTYSVFTCSISGGIITLAQYVDAGNVLLPVTSGDVPVFNGTNGQIKDSGAAMSSTSNTYFATTAGSLTSGNFPTLSDIKGSLATGLPPSAASQAYVVVSPGSFTTGHLLKTADANGTLADQGVQMKTGALVAVVGGAAGQTVTDAFCTSTSCVIANWNDTTNAVEIKTVAAGNGSFVVTSTADPGASHLNYVIFK